MNRQPPNPHVASDRSRASMTEVNEVLHDVIETYNEYRSPMATAELVERGGDWFRVRFMGPFCTTCCRDDYFEDLIYELDEFGVDISPVTVTAIERTGLETFVVDFTVAPEAEAPAVRG